MKLNEHLLLAAPLLLAQLEDLLGPRAASVREEIEKMLAEMVRGVPAHNRLLRLLSEHPETQRWITEYLRVAAPDLTEQPLQAVRSAPRLAAADEATITSYFPQRIAAGAWSTLLAYLHVPGAADDVAADAGMRLKGEANKTPHGKSSATTAIKRGAEVTVVPQLQGCRCNPQSATFAWLEDWHCASFRIQPVPDSVALGSAVNGRVTFYVGPVQIGEVKIWAYLPDSTEPPVDIFVDRSAPIYQSVFPSYSHADVAIVEQIEKAYDLLGMTVLRDARVLRSGDDWSATLQTMIEKADLFQLYWSNNARSSREVEKEWRHALTLGRQGFIRPCFWEQPQPEIPSELKALHFATLVVSP